MPRAHPLPQGPRVPSGLRLQPRRASGSCRGLPPPCRGSPGCAPAPSRPRRSAWQLLGESRLRRSWGHSPGMPQRTQHRASAWITCRAMQVKKQERSSTVGTLTVLEAGLVGLVWAKAILPTVVRAASKASLSSLPRSWPLNKDPDSPRKPHSLRGLAPCPPRAASSSGLAAVLPGRWGFSSARACCCPLPS